MNDKGRAASNVVLPQDFRSRLFEGLTPFEIGAVLAVAKQRRISPNEALQEEGDPPSCLSLVVEGLAAFYKTTHDGRKLFLRWIVPGDAFGLAALLPTRQSYFLTTLAMRGGSLFVWDRVSARSLASEIPRLRENALALAGDYVATLADALAARASQTAQQRIARVLLESGRQVGRAGSKGIELVLTNEQLAHMADVSIFTVCRHLSEWQSQGVIAKGRGTILLRAPKRLGLEKQGK